MKREPLNMKGKACPIPVVQTRKHILSNPQEKEVKVLLDNLASCENVARMARTMGWEARVEDQPSGDHLLVLQKQGVLRETGPDVMDSDSKEDSDSCGLPTRIVALVSGETFGKGEEELGKILMRSFIKTVKELIPRPQCLIFLNSGVFLTTEGSVLVETIQELENTGIEIFSCGTCLDYYHLKDKLRVGKSSNMYEIASLLVGAERVLRI